ncbi:putative regulator of penicillin binding proteins and beta lactamase transcription (morphogene) [Serratia symbiotica str. Tucson]|uniref:DNA-binding transcriptional regulator BolA n=2 Tax=Serratia symbiotica TaxID=138074 RepID=E9CP90_9GAMM|nr:transcriptional regulator BolA [Serratia symbiotica]EFW11681.1 putative regulator of penicillin binding proteins and beta lactamase transcription (morphogene) [Serratia symbiotica str. Tucson]BBI92715.1 regulator of penicillin binding proteins and beta lactamase transcription (Morphogene) [Serratia symbiotica]
MVREQIEAKLKAAFEPTHLDVVDESYRHNVPVSSESHFKVVLVSDRFIGERLLTRHRSIYGVLSEELADGVHALALHTFTLKEWERQQAKVPASPRCRGAGTLA